MTSSTKTSTRPDSRDGIRMDMGLVWANGTVEPTRFAVICSLIILLRATVGFHSVHHTISFARSVTSSDTAHHVGGFGAPQT
jgi:hypothetical protein